MAAFPGQGPQQLDNCQTSPEGSASFPQQGCQALPESARSLSYKRFGSLSSKTPGCLHIPVMKAKKPRSKNPEQLFTLAFLSCRRSWLGNHESSEILYGMSKNKKNKSHLTHSLSPPWGDSYWECLPSCSQLCCPAPEALAVCIPLYPLSRCLSHCL